MGCGSNRVGTLLPINSTDYERYFVLKGVSQEYLIDKIQEYGSMFGTDAQTSYDFDFASVDGWEIVKVDSELDFYYYHNLIAWFLGIDGQTEYPDLSLGVGINKTDDTKSFVTFIDPNNFWGDTEIGLFNDGTEFFVYLPDAYEKQGNLTVIDEKETSFKNLEDYFVTVGFDITVLENPLEFETTQILLQAI
jgi:hypothetical protein